MYEFWYDCIKPKYQNNAELCYMDTKSFIVHIETEDFYEDIADDVYKWFDTSLYEVNRPLPTRKKQKIYWIDGRSNRRKDYDRICSA